MAEEMLCGVYSKKKGCYNTDLFDGGFYFEEVIKSHNGFIYTCKGGGELKFGQKLRFTYKGKSIIATKNSNTPGANPQILLHIVAAKALGFDLDKKIDNVTVEKID